MKHEELHTKIIALDAPILPLEACNVTNEMINHTGSMAIYKGTCLVKDTPIDAEFKIHRIQVKNNTRPKDLKAIFEEFAYDIDLMSRLLTLTHIVNIYGITFRGMDPLLVVESRYDDLDHYLQHHADMATPVSWSDKLQICLGVVRGIEALHNVDIVHGDLRAEKIVLTRNQLNGELVAKIADLGFSYALSSEGVHAGGTAIYMAPERMYTFRCKYPVLEEWERCYYQDIYGVGIVFWQVAMNGKTPYNEAVERRMRPAEIEEMRLRDNNLSILIGRLPREIEPSFKTIIQRSTKLMPKERIELNEIEIILEQSSNLSKISFNESTTADWIQVDILGTVETLGQNKATMKEFANFAKFAFYDSSLPPNISDIHDDIQHWIFAQCQEGASRLRSSYFQYLLACCYNWGFGVEKNMETAFQWLLSAAASESSEVDCMLGEYYKAGIVTQKDSSKAFELFSRAADANNDIAKYLLGLCYYDGEGVAEDRKRAIDLWKKAAKAGVAAAKERLAAEPRPLWFGWL